LNVKECRKAKYQNVLCRRPVISKNENLKLAYKEKAKSHYKPKLCNCIMEI